jgi:hypothetical protein
MALPYTSSFDKTIGFSDQDFQLAIETGTVTSITIPGTAQDNRYVATFGVKSTASIFVGYNVSPTLPSANTATAVARVEFVTPDMQRFVRGADVLYFATPDTEDYIGVSLRSIPNPRN